MECSWFREASSFPWVVNDISLLTVRPPAGNVYYIQNICDRDAKLFFAQARKMPEESGDVDDGESDTELRARSKSAGGRRRDSRASSDTVNGDAPEPKKRRGTSARWSPDGLFVYPPMPN